MLCLCYKTSVYLVHQNAKDVRCKVSFKRHAQLDPCQA